MPKRVRGQEGHLKIRIILWSLMGVGVLLGPFFRAEGKGDAQRNFKDCLSCHQGIEEISPNHKMECRVCHLGPERRSQRTLASHHEIIRNPSDPSTFKDFCLPCHERQIRNLETSLHSTMAGIINQTRYLWGAQEMGSPGIYALSGPFQRLPEPDERVTPDTPELLVDDFLRRRCLSCHIHVKGFPARGLYRASGCAACHVHYPNDGQYRGKDKAIPRGSKGYPARHTLMKTIPNEQCLHCHNQNHVGADYEGLFEQDYSATYRAPLREGRPPAIIYGQSYHHLAKDIHAEKGLWCVDCHGNVMGDGTAYSYSMEVPKTPCVDCHGGYDKDLPNLRVDGITRHETGFGFVSKAGNRHGLPLFSKDSAGHRISAHGKVHCSACHAQWSYQDYGLSVIREDMIQGDKWKGLTAQGDPYLQEVLEKGGEQQGVWYPSSRDWISGRDRPGIWSKGWRFRRWELMPLGVDHKGQYAIMRPMYQYHISTVDRLGNTILDNRIPSRGDGSGKGWAFIPYVPHTISPVGRACDTCHGNRVAAGLGIDEKPTLDTGLTLPSSPPIKTMRLLTAQEQERLIRPSATWKRERLRALTGQ